MSVMTIRGLDEDAVKALRKRAKQEGASINSIVLKLIREQLGLKKKAQEYYISGTGQSCRDLE